MVPSYDYLNHRSMDRGSIAFGVAFYVYMYVLEGPVDKDGKRLYLFVMPLMNRSK